MVISHQPAQRRLSIGSALRPLNLDLSGKAAVPQFELRRAVLAFCSSMNFPFSAANKPSSIFRSAADVATDASLRSITKF